MSKIIILTNNSIGLFDFRKELIQAIISKNNSVKAYTPFDLKVDELRDMGVDLCETKLERRGMNPLKDFKLFFQYLKIIKNERPDLVITYTIKPNVYGGVACSIFNVPYAVNITGLGSAFENGRILKNIAALMNKIACKKAKVVFFENEENRQFFVREHIVKEKQTYRLNGAGVNLERYHVTPYPKGETIKFLFMGRIMKEKGIDELFTAMRRLVQNGVKCELDVLGGYEENYKDIIDKYESEGWLHYYGYQEDVRPYIERCHCFVLPSWHEGMANTNLECAASARPVITSNISGCKEAVIDKKSGFLVEKQKIEDLFDKMKKFTNLTYAEREQMGLVGRAHMEDIFDKKKVVKETMGCLWEN